MPMTVYSTEKGRIPWMPFLNGAWAKALFQLCWCWMATLSTIFYGRDYFQCLSFRDRCTVEILIPTESEKGHKFLMRTLTAEADAAVKLIALRWYLWVLIYVTSPAFESGGFHFQPNLQAPTPNNQRIEGKINGIYVNTFDLRLSTGCFSITLFIHFWDPVDKTLRLRRGELVVWENVTKGLHANVEHNRKRCVTVSLLDLAFAINVDILVCAH